MVTIKVSITDFAQPNEKLGDIDSESNFSLSSVSMELGQRIHQNLQGQRKKQFESYIAEQSIAHKFKLSETLILDVSGRMDGIWKDPSSGEMVIEEIKSTFKTAPLLKELQSKPEHPYIMQLKIYGWIYFIQQNVAPKLRLTVVSTSGRETNELTVEFEPTTFEAWLNERLNWYRLTWIKQQEFLTSRVQLSSKIRFPFAKKRPGQDQLVDFVTQKCKKGGELLVEAATGLGKTAGVLTPAIKIGIQSGRKIFHVTPKNSQLQEAESVIKKIQRRKASIQGLIVTAKSKICMMPEVKCNPNYCKFAKQHYTKVSQLGLIEKALEFPVIKAKHLQQLATDYEVCPYELSKQVMPWVDVIAGDYQYALSPHETFLNASKFPIDMGIKPILSIDESHNLAERSFEWYQMSLRPFPIQAINNSQKKLVKDCRELNSWLLETRRKNPNFENNNSKLRAQDQDQASSKAQNHFDKSRAEVIRNFNIEIPKKILEKFSLHIPAYLESLDRPGGSNAEIDPLILIWFEWLQFVHLYEEKPWLFFGLTTTNTDDIAILCANAGPFTNQILANYHAKIAYSATLKPFSYHQILCGFDQETMQTVEFSSPFPKELRKVIVIPQISTKYKDRRLQIPRIADVIQRIISKF
ncbi:MAG: hypothetical protein NT027_16220 [Proteobacteria bacterium]|nr:hypothetical protein [Pseudomonadota bacterium]